MLEQKKVGDYIVLYLSGRLDVHLSSSIEKDIEEIIKKNPETNLLINLEDVEYMSSSGLRILVATMRILKEKNLTLRLCGLNSAVSKVFEVVELMDMFEVFPNEEKALDA